MSTIDKICLLLKNQSKKQIDLTNYLGISKNVFTDWKAGRNNSYQKYLPQIAEFFNISIDELLDRNRNGQSDNEKLSFALFGTADVDEEVLDDVRKYAQIARKMREEEKNNK